MLHLTLDKRNWELQISHEGEKMTILIEPSRSHEKISVLIDAPKSFAILRGNAKRKTPWPTTD